MKKTDMNIGDRVKFVLVSNTEGIVVGLSAYADGLRQYQVAWFGPEGRHVDWVFEPEIEKVK